MERFETIYARHYKLMFNVANKMVNNKAVAADVVQDVFVSLYQKMERKKNIEYPKSWLYQAVMNKCIDSMRANRKFLSIEQTNTNEQPEELSNDKEQSEIISEALNKLSSKEKALAVLYSEGLSYKEISEVTGIKFTSVGKTLSRTLEKLGNHLKKYEHELY